MVLVGEAQAEIQFHCLQCGSKNPLDPSHGTCSQCGAVLVDADGIFSLVRKTAKDAERRFYDHEYRAKKIASANRPITGLRDLWDRSDTQQNRLLKVEVDDLRGKDILLLGNGASVKELVFLEDGPRRLVYSDLSAQASKAIQSQFNLTPYLPTIRFAALDAEDLPFVDESFDVVYGHAMVHHLPNVPGFLQGVNRVLKPGGKAVFMDDAFSPVWHYSKQTWLRPLMRYSHKRTGISPEDYRFSMSGGFKENELSRIIAQFSGRPFFRRACLLDYLWTRAAEKLLPVTLGKVLTSDAWMTWLVRVDRRLSSFHWYQQNQIRLVWGFMRP